MPTITYDNDFSKLKSLLKYDHFVCKYAQIKSPTIKQNHVATNFKTMEKKQKTKIYQLAFHLVLINVFKFLGLLKPIVIEGLIHSSFPFLDFLSHVIFFCKLALTKFGIFSLAIAY